MSLTLQIGPHASKIQQDGLPRVLDRVDLKQRSALCCVVSRRPIGPACALYQILLHRHDGLALALGHVNLQWRWFEHALALGWGTLRQRFDCALARILGDLILEGPSDQAGVTVAQEVVSCHSTEDMLNLGKMYYDHYLRACMLLPLLVSYSDILLLVRRNKGRTPAASSHPSRRSFETTKELIRSMVVKAPQDHRSAKNNVSVISSGWAHTRKLANQSSGLGSGWFSLRRLWNL